MLVFVIICFLITPIASAPVIMSGLIIDRKFYKVYIFLLAILLAAVGYSFVPIPGSDLDRHFMTMDIMKMQSLTEVLFNGNGLYFQDFIFYLIAKIGNYHLLPAVGGFFTYFCVFYIIANYAQREGVSHVVTLVFIVLFVVTMGFQTPFSGIRNSWAFGMLFLAIYRDLVEGKKNTLTYILYIVPLFLHHSAAILILLRLFLSVYKKINKILLGTIILLYPFGLGLFIKLLEKLSTLNPYFNLLYYKINFTSQRTMDEFTIGYSIQSGDTINTIRKLGTNITFILICLLVFLALRYIYKKNNLVYSKYKNFYIFVIILCIFTLGSYSYVIVFDRFSLSVIFICFPIFISYWKAIMQDANAKQRVMEYIFVVLTLIIVGLVYTYKRNSNYPEWISSFPSALLKTILNVFTYYQ